MRIIDPHIHMVSRTTDDYQRLSLAGVAAVSEPAFWAGFDRSTAAGFKDYFRHLTEFEPRRAAQYGIQHYSWICINPKEAEDVKLARDVIAIIPEFLKKPTVLGVGEIGLNKNTRNELTIFEEHVALALREKQLILIHTPHLEDKHKGTKLIVDCLKRTPGIDPGRVIVDHVEEHTIKLVRDAGFWCGITLYPISKVTPERAIDMVEQYGNDRIWLNSAGDWGDSNPMNTLVALQEARRRGHSEAWLERLFYNNPCYFFGQNPKFKLQPTVPVNALTRS